MIASAVGVKNSPNYTSIRLLADYNHGGIIDPEKPSSDIYAIALPVSDLPTARTFRRWSLVGDVDPLDVGTVILTLDGPLSVSHKIEPLETLLPCTGCWSRPETGHRRFTPANLP